MRQKINVIDLDDTLIPYDSMRSFYFKWLLKARYFLPLIYLLVLRLAKILDRATFVTKFYVTIKNDPEYIQFCNAHANEIMMRTNNEVLQMVAEHTSPGTINILVTASFEDYCLPAANKLNWKLLGSKIINGRFYHNYGKNKITLLSQTFPADKYEYNFSISDSATDNDLLALFNHACLYKPKAA